MIRHTVTDAPLACAALAPIFDDPTPHDVPGLRRLCAACPIVTACAVDALADVDAAGFRAGMTEWDRAAARRRHHVPASLNVAGVCEWCGAPTVSGRRGPRRRFCNKGCSAAWKRHTSLAMLAV